jgi:hypothetical protein
MLWSVLVLVVVVSSGVALTYAVSPRLRVEERLAIGVVVGVLSTNVIALVLFPVVGMGAASVGAGVLVPLAAAGVVVRTHRSAIASDVRRLGQRLRLRSAATASLRPLAVLTIAAAAVSTRILSLAYQTTPAGISAGSLATWSDWSAHLAYAGSFAYGDNRGFDMPTATGTGFRYHFLADFAGAVFTVTGSTLQQSMVLSEWVLAVAFVPLLWCLVMRIVRSRLVAALTIGLFVLSGGVGLWYFAQDVENNGWSVISRLPRTYARIPEVHLWVDNTISASLYAQRSTLLGLTTGMAAGILLLASRPGWHRRGFLVAGLMVGVLGIGHAHTMLTMLALAGLCAVLDRRRDWLWFLVPVVVIGGPLAASILPERSSIRVLVGWMAPAADQSWPVFWLRNVGLLLPLALGISLFGGVPSRVRRMVMPLWLWFIVPNVIAFHPSEWNNTKYFLFWQLGSCLAIACLLARPFSAVAAGRTRVVPLTVVQVGAVVVALVMMSAGALDTLRAMQRSSAIPWVTHDDMAAAAFLRTTPTGSIIVYGATNTSAAAALGGRAAVSGYPGWTYDLGIDDWAARWEDATVILQGADGTESAIDRYGVDYVVIGPSERADHAASDDHWGRAGDEVFRSGDVVIYAVRPG